MLTSGSLLAQIAASGSEAPALLGAPTKFGVIGNPILNDGGNTAFQAFVSGTTKASINYPAIFAESGTSHSLGMVALAGAAAPDESGITGGIGSFESFGDPVFNNNDQVAFMGRLKTGGSANGGNRQGIWANTSGILTMVARAQDQAPGCPVGANIHSFVEMALTNQGGVIFLANLAGASGGVNSSNNKGIWAVDTSRNLKLLARKGDVLMIDGMPKVISGLSLFTSSAGTTGQTRSFNQGGDVIIKATFSDRTVAIAKAAAR